MSYQDQIARATAALDYLSGRHRQPSHEQLVCAVFNAVNVRELREALREVLTYNNEDVRDQASEILARWDEASDDHRGDGG